MRARRTFQTKLSDIPAAACARCIWWQRRDEEGWGKCLVHHGESHWYQCMVCPEYEMDPELGL